MHAHFSLQAHAALKRIKICLEKNPGLAKFREIVKIMEGEEGKLPEDWSAGDAAALKYCPAASVAVEGSFSTYKSMLADNIFNIWVKNVTYFSRP